MLNLSRRRLLAASVFAAIPLRQSRLHADETTSVRPSSSKFKFSLAAYSYRNLLAGKRPSLTLFDFVDDCARFGLEGTELTSYYFPPAPTTDYLTNLRRYCFRRGLDVSGTAIRNDFGWPDGERRKQEIAHAKAWIDHASKLGAPVIRIFAGHQQKATDSDTTHRLMVRGIEECCEYAGERGIHLALENHGGPTATADGLLRLVNDVKSRWFGVNLDTGNFHVDDPYAHIEKVAKHAINVQIKVVTESTTGTKRPTDFKKLASILKHSGYRGYVVLEYEEGGDPRSESERYLELLRKSFV